MSNQITYRKNGIGEVIQWGVFVNDNCNPTTTKPTLDEAEAQAQIYLAWNPNFRITIVGWTEGPYY